MCYFYNLKNFLKLKYKHILINKNLAMYCAPAPRGTSPHLLEATGVKDTGVRNHLHSWRPALPCSKKLTRGGYK